MQSTTSTLAQDSPPSPERVSLLSKVEAAGPMLSNSVVPSTDRSPVNPIPLTAEVAGLDLPAPRTEPQAPRAASSRLPPLALALMGAVVALLAVGLGWLIVQESRSGVLWVELPPGAAGKQGSIIAGGEELRDPGRGPVIHRMRAGASSLLVDVEGYEIFGKKIEVRSGRDPTRIAVDLKPRIQMAQLAVIADPESAEIVLDGKVVKAGGSPGFYFGDIPVGPDQLLQIRHPGFEVFERRITAAPGEHVQVRATLQPLEISLRLSSRPSGARILVSGRRVGRTPSEVRVPANAGELTLMKKCFEPLQVPLTLPSDLETRDPNDPLAISVSLKRVPGCP